ncbi:unnamed protein product [Caenorhabditis angaria]|uniref:Uncharacterized protein n=1 Tax=Caenorhabditis angaria TaxID=860376 RepID=A0A9P1IRD5_9PELO|nr:unnamed protein product [Caenorhabditis angaria]
MSDGSPERGQKRNEHQLESKQINVQYKRYYVDVNENDRGRFFKIAELGSNYKGRITLIIPAAIAIRDELNVMVELLDKPLEGDAPTGKEAVVIKSETLNIDGRRFYIDLKENERGRFLRIAQMPRNPRQQRQQISIPCAGVVEIRNTLTDFLNKYSEGYTAEPEAQNKITAENKSFLFNVGENERGQFLRISEIKLNTGYRSAITIPLPSLNDFRKALDDAAKEKPQARA